jgi:hypothetical protein
MCLVDSTDNNFCTDCLRRTLQQHPIMIPKMNDCNTSILGVLCEHDRLGTSRVRVVWYSHVQRGCACCAFNFF